MFLHNYKYNSSTIPVSSGDLIILFICLEWAGAAARDGDRGWGGEQTGSHRCQGRYRNRDQHPLLIRDGQSVKRWGDTFLCYVIITATFLLNVFLCNLFTRMIKTYNIFVIWQCWFISRVTCTWTFGKKAQPISYVMSMDCTNKAPPCVVNFTQTNLEWTAMKNIYICYDMIELSHSRIVWVSGLIFRSTKHVIWASINII